MRVCGVIDCDIRVFIGEMFGGGGCDIGCYDVNLHKPNLQ